MPSLPPRNVTGRQCRVSLWPRVYLFTHPIRDWWRVQYLEADPKTPLGRMYDYTSIDLVREILTRANADADAWQEFESGLRKWGIGACYLTLTPEQYKRLALSSERAKVGRWR